ncbi:MAG: DUF4124 domain-containing protein [Porticoccus sp.]
MGRINRTMLALCCLIGMMSGASAAVYKCVDAKGNTTFSDRPCSSTAKVVDKDEHDSTKKKSNDAPKKTKGAWGGYMGRARKVGEE